MSWWMTISMHNKSKSLCALATILVAACSDPLCPIGNRNVGTRCISTTLDSDDASISMDGSTIDSGNNMDASSDADCEERCKPDDDVAPQACDEPADCTNAALPHCGPAGKCVACLESAQCPAGAPVCSGSACAACTGPNNCSGRTGTLACDTASGSCVECTAEDDHACTSRSKVCVSDGTTCVECNVNTDCPNATPQCSNHACEPCSDNNQCEGRTEGNTSLHLCVGEQCVQCTPETEAQHCGQNACDPKTLTCTSTKRNSLATCRECRSDNECIANHKCIEVPFQGQPSGWFCMRQVPVAGGCQVPYQGAPLAKAKPKWLFIRSVLCAQHERYDVPCSGFSHVEQELHTGDGCHNLRRSRSLRDGQHQPQPLHLRVLE